jgi:5-methylcytosine-specific restriction endonuclease McrA
MSKVFVLDTTKHPLDPVHPGRARWLLTNKKAAVFRQYPFTIILKQIAEESVTEPATPLRLKIDPGSKTTGVTIVDNGTGEIPFASELSHRGSLIRDRLLTRKAVRRSRRARKTRYRQARFLNRRRSPGWLPPSLSSRVSNILTWVNRLRRLCPLGALSMELVRFDTQLMESPEIQGIEYQRGILAGYEVREYLLEKWGRQCAYCSKSGVPLQIEHIVPKARGGSNRVSNLTLACQKCNQRKGTLTATEFGYAHIQAKAKVSLRDAAAVNVTRWSLYRNLLATGLPVEVGTGGRTKYNRVTRNLPKTHWLDAACVGASTPPSLKTLGVVPLRIEASGHGNRARCRTDRYGFPRLHRSGNKRFFGFQTGDLVEAVVPAGKKTGKHTGRVAVRAGGSFDISTRVGNKVTGVHHRHIRLLQGADGYNYSFIEGVNCDEL